MVVGGMNIPREGTSVVVGANASVTSPLKLVYSLSAPRDSDGNLLVLNADGTAAAQKFKDVGVFDILSREVIRLRIPPGVATVTRADGSLVVEAFISTSTGISSKLQIPVRQAAKPAPPPVFSPIAENPSLALADSTLTIQEKYTAGPPASTVRVPFGPGTRLRIVPTGGAARPRSRLGEIRLPDLPNQPGPDRDR